MICPLHTSRPKSLQEEVKICLQCKGAENDKILRKIQDEKCFSRLILNIGQPDVIRISGEVREIYLVYAGENNIDPMAINSVPESSIRISGVFDYPLPD